THSSWASLLGRRRICRTPTEGAKACGSGTEAKIGRDRDASRRRKPSERLSNCKAEAGGGDHDAVHSPPFNGKKADRGACRQIRVAGYLPTEGLCRSRWSHVLWDRPH